MGARIRELFDLGLRLVQLRRGHPLQTWPILTSNSWRCLWKCAVNDASVDALDKVLNKEFQKW